MTAHNFYEISDQSLIKRMHGELYTAPEHIDHAPHMLRTYFKSSLLKQYENQAALLRNELCSNSLRNGFWVPWHIANSSKALFPKIAQIPN